MSDPTAAPLTPIQAYHQHVAELMSGDLDAVVAGYADDAVLVGNGRIGHGHEHIRAVFAEALQAAMDLQPEVSLLEDGDTVFASWTAGSGSTDTPSMTGADTFVVADGLITVHTGFVAVGTPAAGLA